MKDHKLVRKLLFFLLLAFTSGCANQLDVPVISEDGTVVYPSKKKEEVRIGISFFKDEDKKSGFPVGIDTVFTLGEKENIRTQIVVEQIGLEANKLLMFHLDWIGPDGRSFFTKRIDHFINDSSNTVKSSVSLSPDKRLPGKHLLKVYFFRELIAEKSFTLIPQHALNYSMNRKFSPIITLCEKPKTNSGEYLGADTVFTRSKKAKVRVYVDLKNISEPLTFDLQWIGPDGNKFYSKEIEITSEDSPSTLYSSISIPAEKREPGKYAVEVYLFDELIASKIFLLK
ncbi:MAG: hypothetical protein K9H16_15455 [Bacteroidales bacterium]|nr:hypothetical protein [Bacteroidales bacterium]